MHSFFDPETVFGLGTIVLLALLLRSFLKTFNIGLGLIITVMAIGLVLQYGFDLSPRELWYEFRYLPQNFSRLLQRVG